MSHGQPGWAERPGESCLVSRATPFESSQKHAIKCTAVAESHIPDDPDQPAGGATPSVEPKSRGNSEAFVPRVIEEHVEPDPIDQPPREDTSKIDVDLYLLSPEPTTVIRHPKFQLSSYDLVINTIYKILICLSCRRCIEPHTAETHVGLHISDVVVPEGMAEELMKEFDLLSVEDIPIPKNMPAPIFGLQIIEERCYFCTRCKHGFTNRNSLRSHQNTKGRCHRPDGEENAHFIGHGQRFTDGAFNSIFPVDPTKLPLRSDADPTPLDIYQSAPVPAFDYRNIPFAIPTRELDLNSFAYREGWKAHVAGWTPAQIAESCRGSTPADDLDTLKDNVVSYIKTVQPEIAKCEGFGLQKLMANVGLSDSLAGFNKLSPDSCKKYGLLLWRLVFNLLRQIAGEDPPPYPYPLTETQTARLNSLLRGWRYNAPAAKMESLVHSAVNSLYSHRNNNNQLDKFFSSVSCFAVLISWTDTGGLRPASTITSLLMQLIYANRTTQMLEMRVLMDADETLDRYGAYEKVKIFLQDMQETPMSFLFNVYCLLKVIRSDESAEGDVLWCDVNGMELTFLEKRIQIPQFKTLYLKHMVEYDAIVKDDILMGRDLSPELLRLNLDVRELMDDPKNRAPGHCFIDNRQNQCGDWSELLAHFLLSDPTFAAKYTYIHNGQLVWRPGPSFKLLKTCDRASDELVLAWIVGAAACGRGTDMANECLRNSSGSTIRNVQILYRNLCFVGLQDKTSHQRLTDRYVPSAPPTLLAQKWLFNLAVIRPFQVYLARQLLGETEALRFHEYLHPRLGQNLSSASLSSMLGDSTQETLGCRLPITNWRKIMGTIAKRHANSRDFELNKNYYFDIVAHHTTGTADAVYQQAGGNVAGISPRHIVGCINYSISWQKLTGIDEGFPLSVQSVGADEEETVPFTGEALPVAHIDPRALATEVFKSLQPDLTRFIQQQIANSIISSQALYWPKPIPAYAPHELRELCDIQPHPSRATQISGALHCDNFIFSCWQQQVLLEKMLARTTNILAILRCGSGKTFLTFLAAKVYNAGRTTIVILPHSGLHSDFVRRADELQITCSKWDSRGNFDPNAKIIWAAVEHLEFDAFDAFLSQLALAQRIDRIAFDEVHKVLTDAHYRKVFLKFGILGKYGAPILAGSGTIPPHLMPQFFKASGIDAWDIVRMSISRPNIILSVKLCDNKDDLQRKLINFVHSKTAQYDEYDRLMIFCQRVQQAIDIATLFGTEAYYSGNEENDNTLEGWRRGDFNIIVSSSLLGSGTDYAWVRNVINVGFPFTAFDLQQQFDRAGRDGECAEATTFVLRAEKVPHANEREVDLGEDVMYEWAHSDDCRRIMPSLYFDGVPTTCTTLNAAVFCDNCLAKRTRSAPEIPLQMPVSTFPNARALREQSPPRLTRPLPTHPRRHPAGPAAPTSKHSTIIPPDDTFFQPLSISTGARIKTPRQVFKFAAGQSRSITPPTYAEPPLGPNVHLAVVKRGAQSIYFPPPQQGKMQPLQFVDYVAHSTPELHPTSPSRFPKNPATPPRHRAAPNAHAVPSAAVSPPRFRDRNPAHAPSHFRPSVPAPPNPSTDPATLRAQHLAADRRISCIQKTFTLALDTLKDHCPPCWVLGLRWDHPRGTCRQNLADDENDKVWQAWHRKAFSFPEGYCWYCMIPQSKIDGWHPWVKSVPNCPHKNLIKPAIYAFLVANENSNLHLRDCPFIPDDVLNDDESFTLFRYWAVEHAPDLPGGNLLNIHRFFLWLVFQRRLIVVPPELAFLFP
ncbi:hypothetical protein C8R44DRAFT_894729 [Mycena epipterygia]|nr:hypothetical protein C8R44DRAFT_894729 [Mycena epipterygia]